MRLLRRDVVSYVCTLPSSVLLIVCLFLPQQQTCNGRVQTPLDNGTAFLLIIMALVGFMPLSWRIRSIRNALTFATVGTALLAAVMSAIGIIFALVLGMWRPWRSNEELVALCCFALTLAFILIFPFVFIFSHDLIGGDLSWLAAWPIGVGVVTWSSAACTRTALGESSSHDDARIC